MENVSQDGVGEAQGQGETQSRVSLEVRNPVDCVTDGDRRPGVSPGREPDGSRSGVEGDAAEESKYGQDAHTTGGGAAQDPPATEEELAGDPRYDVSAMLGIYGLTYDEMKNPGAALVSGGLKKLWAVARVMRMHLIAKVRAAREAMLHPKSAFQKALEEENDPRDPRWVAEMREWAEQEEEAPHKPIWQIISGLGGKDEADMSPDQRNECIAALLDVVARLAKAELEKQKDTPRRERSYLWDPLPQICVYLGIARAKLSRYSKELTGMAAHEIVDKMRIDRREGSHGDAIESSTAESQKCGGAGLLARVKGVAPESGVEP